MERNDFDRNETCFETPDIHSSSPSYARRFSGGVGGWFLDVQNQTTTALLGGQIFDSVLDVGGGHCQNLQILLRNYREVTVVGSDVVSPDLLSPFIQDKRVKFKSAPLTQTELADRSFGLVLSYRILAHMQDWKLLVAELCRLAQHTVMVDFPVRAGVNIFSEKFFFIKKVIEGNTRPYTLFQEEEICREFQGCGFALHSRRAQFFWPMAMHRLHGSARFGKLLEILPAAVSLTTRFGSPVIARFDRQEN